MTTLTKDQQACVAFPEERNLIVRGVAGSGKSLVLLNRALNLSRKAKANGGALSIGLFTFANTLVNYTDEVLDVEGEASNSNITVKTLDKVIYALYKDITARSPQHPYESNKKDKHRPCLDHVIIKHFVNDTEHERILSDDRRDWLMDELCWMKQHSLKTVDEYVAISRRGRGRIPLRTEDRPFVFSIYKAYYQELARRGITTIDMMCETILERSVEIPDSHRYDVVMIDEAQDLPVNKLKVARALARISMTISADFAQKIYGSAFTWKEIGLEIKGRDSRRLKGTHRNTRQIVDLADSLLKHYTETPEDDEIFNRDRPEREGAEPKLFYCQSEDEMRTIVLNLIKNLRSASPRTTVGILVRDSLVMKIVKRWLENVRIDYAPIGDKKIHALALTPGVKLVTYHSAKGLEFDHVILPMVNDDLFPYTRNETDFSEEATENRMNEARMLLFVGMTRARHTLALLAQESFDVRPSRLLNELAPDAVEIVR